MLPFVATCLVLASIGGGPFRTAQIELPPELSNVPPATVEGANPRAWKKPLSFADYATRSVDDGTTFSWSTELFGVRGGKARRVYRLTLETPAGALAGIECRTRSIDAWRSGWTVELTDAFQPRLACGLDSDDGRPARLVLGSNGRRLTGRVESAGGIELEISSIHRLAGSPLPSESPAGYALSQRGTARAVVEVLNRGRVWISPELDEATRDLAAGAIAALLLYDPELSPEAFGDD